MYYTIIQDASSNASFLFRAGLCGHPVLHSSALLLLDFHRPSLAFYSHLTLPTLSLDDL